MAFSLWTRACDQLNPITGQQKNHLNDSCQLTMTWMSIRTSTINLNTDYICLGHLASNAWSLRENNVGSTANQSSRTIVAI